MQSFLLFKSKSLDYAIDLEKLEHIMMIPELTENADGEAVSEGMMEYNGEVIEVYSFREMIGLASAFKDTQEMFVELKKQHKAWINALEDAVHKDVKFSKTTNPHACHLGKWIDSFSSNSDEVNRVLRSLKSHHSSLHKSAIDVLEHYEESPQKAVDWVDSHVKDIYKKTIAHLDEMATHSKQVASDSQKLLIINDSSRTYGLKVDEVDNIIHVEEDAIMINDSLRREDKYLTVSGVIKYDDRLISIVEQFNLKDSR